MLCESEDVRTSRGVDLIDASRVKLKVKFIIDTRNFAVFKDEFLVVSSACDISFIGPVPPRRWWFRIDLPRFKSLVAFGSHTVMVFWIISEALKRNGDILITQL
jgi:hypothetical protein